MDRIHMCNDCPVAQASSTTPPATARTRSTRTRSTIPPAFSALSRAESWCARAWLQCSDWQQLPGARRLLQSCSMLLPELSTRRWLTRTAAGGRTLLLPIICHLTCEQTTTSKADSSREWRRCVQMAPAENRCKVQEKFSTGGRRKGRAWLERSRI